MSCNCPKKYGSAEYERLAPTSPQAQITTMDKVAKETLKELVEKMGAFVKTPEGKQEYFNLIIEKGFV